MNAAGNGYDTEAMGSSYEEALEWDNIGIFGAGLAAGLALGAALALLLAPLSGEETRELLGERSRWVTDRVSGRFGDLRENVERATRRSRRKLHRGITRGRWMVEDMTGR
ncbi:MAG TPA: YtxH domain-containing protein [Gemmatimonadaceae bacterium]|nr:YtxH domain-containing protein [Gemmatimonadaceae bacterium]